MFVVESGKGRVTVRPAEIAASLTLPDLQRRPNAPGAHGLSLETAKLVPSRNAALLLAGPAFLAEPIREAPAQRSFAPPRRKHCPFS
jgi:hypothetical protein